MYDIKVNNAKLRGCDRLACIGILGCKIGKMADVLPEEAETVIDAEGNLVTESFVNRHLHLCKVCTLEKVGQEALGEYQSDGMGNAQDSIRSASEFKTS